MTTVQKAAPAVVLGVIALALLFALIPFKLADGQVTCGPPLFGANPNVTERVGQVEPEEDCLSRGRSKLLFAGFMAVFAAAGGVAVVALDPDNIRPDWLNDDVW